MKAMIFDIKRCSKNDGPGIRTTVFFKGCNLDCFWCHNPEGKSPEKQYALFQDKCTDCGTCRRQENVSEEEKTKLCPVGARRIYGREYTVEELFQIISLDKPYYTATGGGVTFSGGECMLHIDFLTALAQRCKQEGISVAIDTAGHVPYAYFKQILPYADLFLYDVKCLDPDLHKRGTKRDNALILENLDRLIKDVSKTNSDKKIIIRVPVVPNFNDGAELQKIQSYCKDRGLPVELLAYHEYGVNKKNALQNKE